MNYVLRTKPFQLKGETCYGFADGVTDNITEKGYYDGLRLDTSHKLKWADIWDNYDEVLAYKKEWDKEDEFEIVEYEIAAKEYYGE